MAATEISGDCGKARAGGGSLLSGRAGMATYYGKLPEAQGFLQQAVDEAKSHRSPKRAANYLAGAANGQATIGNLKEAKVFAQQALALDGTTDTQNNVATVFARAGYVASVQKPIDLQITD